MSLPLHSKALYWADRQNEKNKTDAKAWKERLETLSWQESRLIYGFERSETSINNNPLPALNFFVLEELLKDHYLDRKLNEQQKRSLIEATYQKSSAKNLTILIENLTLDHPLTDHFFNRLIEKVMKNEDYQKALDAALEHPDTDLSYDTVMSYFQTSISIPIAHKLLQQENIQQAGFHQAVMMFMDEHFTEKEHIPTFIQLWQMGPSPELYSHLLEQYVDLMPFRPYKTVLSDWAQQFFLPFDPSSYSDTAKDCIDKLGQRINHLDPVLSHLHEQLKVNYHRDEINRGTESLIFAKPTASRRL